MSSVSDSMVERLEEAEATHPASGDPALKPLALVWREEATFAQLGRWRRLSRCFEGSAQSARAWLEVACVGYMLGRV